jgi:hypothetical protein
MIIIKVSFELAGAGGANSTVSFGRTLTVAASSL